MLIPVQTQVLTPQVPPRLQVQEKSGSQGNPPAATLPPATQASVQTTTHKPFKGGSIGLFFRKVK